MNRAERYQRSLKVIDKLEEHWDPIHKVIDEKVGFLIDGKHYADDDEDDDKTSDAIRWVGQESFHAWRHEVGLVTQAPDSISARPLDMDGDDPELGEQAVSLLESEWDNPAKEFAETMEDVVGCASAAGYGVATLDWLPDEGRWGEVVPRMLDPRSFGFDPRVKSPHSLRCRWVYWKERFTRDEIDEMAGRRKGQWKPSVAAKLTPDSGFTPGAFRTGGTFPGILPSKGEAKEWTEDDATTVYFLWYRKSDDVKDEGKEGTFTDFEPEDRYMACRCGYRSQTQGELGGGELPEFEQCPECSTESDPGIAHRIDGLEDVETLRAFPKGKLEVFAPFCGSEDFLYEGPWLVPCRSYPVMFLSRFRHPFKTHGPSIADLNWWNQVSTDMIMRLALERMVQSAPFWVLPREGVEDAEGQDWQFSDENGWAMYYTGDSMPQIELMEGTGIPAAWSAVYQAAMTALTARTGIADFGLGPNQSRDIPASSVAQQIQQQEIPQAHYQRRYQREKGRFLGILYDYQKMYPDQRIARMKGVNGADAIRAIKASNLPDFDFFITDVPDFSATDEANEKAFNAITTTIEQKPWALDLATDVFKWSPSLVRKAKEAFARSQQPPPPGTPGAAPAPGAPAPMGAPAVAAPPGGASAPQAPQYAFHTDDPAAMVQALLSSMGAAR